VPSPSHDGAEGTVEVAPGVHLWYRVVGGDGPWVVVPTTGNDADFAPLCRPDRRVLFYDVRGRGRSDRVDDPRRLGFLVEVADLDAVRAALAVERWSALGWSYHAGVVASHAMVHPGRVERLVLAASIPARAGVLPSAARRPAPHALAALDQLEADGGRQRDPGAVCMAWRSVYVPLLMGDPSAFERMAPVCHLPNEWPWNVSRALVHVFADLSAYDWRPRLRDVAAPVLVAHGSEDADPVEAAQEWVDALPDARLLVVDGAGQFPWIERPERFFGVVDAFLAGRPV
jgi:proline iminopeptidase